MYLDGMIVWMPLRIINEDLEERMVKVIKYGQKRRVTCKHCGALLEFEQGDLKTVQTGMNEYEQQIICASCGEIVTIN